MTEPGIALRIRYWSMLALWLVSTSMTLVCQADATGLRYLALGDSYTIGEGVVTQDRWPVQLAGRLGDKGYDITETVFIARTGWTVDALIAACRRYVPKNRFDLVTLQIGVNDEFRGRPAESIRNGIRYLLERATDYADGDKARVIVVSIPDWHVTPMATSMGRDEGQGIDQYNPVIREEAEAADIIFLDITDISRQISGRRDLFVSDGLHPSRAMYQLWGDRLTGPAESILKNARK